MLDELIEAVARGAHLSPESASLAVAAMLRFLTARLPSPLVGALHAMLRTRPSLPPESAASLANAADPADPATSAAATRADGPKRQD